MNPHSVITVYATVPREILNLTGHVIWCEHCGGTIAVGEIHRCRELLEDSKCAETPRMEMERRTR